MRTGHDVRALFLIDKLHFRMELAAPCAQRATCAQGQSTPDLFPTVPQNVAQLFARVECEARRSPTRFDVGSLAVYFRGVFHLFRRDVADLACPLDRPD